MLPVDLKEFQEKVSTHFRPWQRSFQFWVRAVDIYTGYKVFQVRVNFEKNVEKRESMWERQHEVAADKIYNMCADLGGFFLKVAQIIGKPDLAPAAWVRRLVTLCDQAPATPYSVIKVVVEQELGQSVDELFERFDFDPLGSASIAQLQLMSNQVHRARIKGDKSDVVVKVQHPGVQDLMMTDIRNLQAFALYMQKTDIKFDLYSVTKEMEKQSSTWRVLVMEYIDGVPILKLGDEMAKRGINPGGKVAAAAKQNILKSLTLAYGQMILRSGFFHADPHPGNILICRGSEVALLDYGQVKDLPEKLRLGYASLVLAIADNDPIKASESYSYHLANNVATLLRRIFNQKIAVQAFPEELFSVLRTVHLLRGLSVGLGINYSCAEQWRPIAEEALYLAGRLTDKDLKGARRRGIFRRIFGR
ncbi:hypothetical protein DH2020_019045 [Rehmannia glutinosa]|uniref:ABC1 atypical kinase-like domain-containing protein n=1 Tax=Rehmannia glutinosa TaxID=99300 RepID=A0ABR0WKP4_REHGL